MASHNVPRTATTELKTDKQLQEEKLEIDKYRNLVDQVESKFAEGYNTPELLGLTSRLLTKNPEYYTIWNVRRRLLISGISSTSSVSSSPSTVLLSTSATLEPPISSADSSSSTANSSKVSSMIREDQDHQKAGKSGITLETIRKDLDFVVPLLKQWPKCYWIWNHRVWLLNQATERLEVAIARKLWQGELALVSMMLVRDNRNFHGWGYRRMVVEQLESQKLNGVSMVESEFDYTTKMINANLSNFSAWHNRSILIPRVLDERHADDAARKEFLDKEFDMIRDGLWTDSFDQSLWFYYQYLMSNLIDYVGHSSIVPNLSTNDRIEYIDHQLVDLRDMLDGAEDCKWIYNALFDYTTAIIDMQGREPVKDEEADLRAWLDELRKLDTLRKGRWDEMAKVLHQRRI